MRATWLLFTPTVLFPYVLAAQVDHAVADVNPFIGTGGHGHTFPGACVPNGLVQLSPDTRPSPDEWDGCGGYHYTDSVIHGFSHTHLSGTGVPDLCDVLLMPMDHTPDAMEFTDGHKPWLSPFSHAKESAHAGYYRVHLDAPDVEAELTATARAGVHRYTWPKGKEQVLILDLKHRDKLLNGSILQVSKTEITGERRSSSWAKDQHLFFCIRTNKPMFPSTVPLPGDPPPSRTPGLRTTQAFILGRSDGTPLIVKVGISAVSVDGARRNLDAEVPEWDFDKVRAQAEAAWNVKLGRIEVEGGTREQRRVFYTALYHCYAAPNIFNDVDGDYRGMDGQVHHADHNVYTVFSLWDTYRALHPLMTILEPDMTSDFIKTFLLHYQQGGRLPVWELWGNETDCMIGYHSASVIADAYIKGIRDFDADLALKAMVASAMADNPGLNAYRTRGYISSEDESDCVSKTLEYAYDDWCIAQMAMRMRDEARGDTARYWRLDSVADQFRARGRNYQNTFNPRTSFFQARANGGFKEPFDPFEVNFNYTEANAWQYSMAVQQGTAELKDLYGFELADRLDALFHAKSATTGREQADITGLIGQYAHGNEPSHHMAYLYNAVDRPWKTADVVHRIMTEFYHDAPDGLIGNEDCGQMSAWFVMSAMGFYPISPGSTGYSGGTPLFDRLRIGLADGKTFHLIARREHPLSHVVQTHYPGGWGIDHARIMKGDPMFIDLVDEFDPRLVDSAPSSVLDGAYIRPSAVPYILASSRTFTDSLRVTIGCLKDRGFTYDVNRANETTVTGGEVSFTIHETSEIRAWTGLAPVVSHFDRIEGGRTVKLESAYANQYAAGGDQALVDGQRGNSDFRTGEWQGFREHDLLATVDLGKVKKLKRVGLGVLQDQKSWIWYPASVTFAWSTNGRTWSSRTVENTVDRKADGSMVAEMWTNVIGKSARYVKVMAKNAGPCPDWHPGKGGTTWIFADEILIEAP